MLKIHPEVTLALRRNRPVVCLESTIVAHGMPYPENVKMAREVGAIIRENGAIPATVACFNGYIHVGLTDAELDRLASEKNVMKVSRRDLPYALAEKKTAATTVASTMIAAEMAGIRVFVTGGIGGVHRGWNENPDISADLIELSQTSVAVVSAGAKAILDLPATLELLETLGVPVLSYQSDEFGAFYSSRSGQELEMRVEDAASIARFLTAKWSLGLHGGVLVSNPIPEEYEIPKEKIEPHIRSLMDRAKQLGIRGKKLTPFLLAGLKEATDGASLKANIALVKNNARLGARIATELAGKKH